MKRNKKFSIRVRVSESMKLRLTAYILKNDCSEAEGIRRLLNKSLQSSVAKARQIVQEYTTQEVSQ